MAKYPSATPIANPLTAKPNPSKGAGVKPMPKADKVVNPLTATPMPKSNPGVAPGVREALTKAPQ